MTFVSILTILLGWGYELFTINLTNKSNRAFINNIIHKNASADETELNMQSYYAGIEMRMLTNYTQFATIIITYLRSVFPNVFSYMTQMEVTLSLASNPSSA